MYLSQQEETVTGGNGDVLMRHIAWLHMFKLVGVGTESGEPGKELKEKWAGEGHEDNKHFTFT